MILSHALRNENRSGQALVLTVMLLAIAGVTIGSMLTAQTTYTRNIETTYSADKATFLADSGLRAAIVKLNASSDAAISYAASRNYFADSNSFSASDWGFQTQLSITNGSNLVVSTGRYNGQMVKVQSIATLGSGNRSLHAMYAHALFAGNSSGTTNYALSIGGTGSGADFVKGDVYSGRDIALSGDARLRLPEIMCDTNHNGMLDPGETWTNSYATQTFASALGGTNYATYSNAFMTYSNSVKTNMTRIDRIYNNGKYDKGEAFLDTIGNGQYDLGEPFLDVNGNHVRDPGDSYIDRNSNGVYDAGIDTVVDRGNGQYDAGEEWVEDNVNTLSGSKVRVNGRWDAAGGYWKKGTGTNYTWTTSSKTKNWAAEQYQDVGDGVYQAEEPYIDQNGIYDEGESYVDDRNSVFDYGTASPGKITGMPTPGPGQKAATGGDDPIDPPDLVHMYYSVNHTSTPPADALTRWGNDVLVTAADYGSAIAITDSARPEHIFLRNPPIGSSGSVSSGGKTIYKRSYTTTTNSTGHRIDDYFLEDPTDSTFNNPDTTKELDGTSSTAPMFINVQSSANSMLYYIDGNVWIHSPQGMSFRFRQPGTRITIVANGNITISDEFYYNADYPAGLQRTNVNSSIVKNPSDVLCLIALKNPDCAASGNVYIGDAQFGTGGSIHAMLYAENDFVDNNINTSDQSFISIFGNMTAGNLVDLNRVVDAHHYRTRLDLTLDERIRNGEVIVPGLPHPVGSQRSIQLDTAWQIIPGTWQSWSRLK